MSRKFIYLENVKSILSKQNDMKDLMYFLIKACCSRGLTLSWTSVALENVGLPAQRRRTFFFAVVKGCRLFQELEFRPINTFFQEPFNPRNSLPLHQCLTVEKPTDQDNERLKILGNVVVPACADLASAILHCVVRQGQGQVYVSL
ncbi:unnamed protein product [Durusdinium trenchii]|uniref:Uncharacterized protein n=1 Tax=Durusdinium trenchii TaxID=1381693 RepID=A0ABP0NDK5_9DINO